MPMCELFAKRYVGEVNTGNSRPIIVECNDNNNYVIKYTGNQVSNKVLINDLTCCRLAKLLGITVPDAKVIYIPEALIEIEPNFKKYGILPGNHFGSFYYDLTVAFTGSNVLNQVGNKEQIPKIIAFDYWVQNDDRSDNLGNILISTSKSNKQIIAIDYGNAFNGPDWINEDLLDYEIMIIPIDGAVYSCFFNEIKDEGCFDEICTDIESLTMSDIEDCVRNIPVEWGLDESQKNLICIYLYNRRYKVRDTMEYLMREKLNKRR